MTAWVIYSTQTGVIRYCTDYGYNVGTNEGEDVLEVAGLVSPSAWYVDVATKQLVPAPAPTPDPMIMLRRERNRLLVASDWTRLDDVALTAAQREEAKAYRAALRDAPATGSLPTPPSWLFPGGA